MNQKLYHAVLSKEGVYTLLGEAVTSPDAVMGVSCEFSRIGVNGVIDCSPIVPEAKPCLTYAVMEGVVSHADHGTREQTADQIWGENLRGEVISSGLA